MLCVVRLLIVLLMNFGTGWSLLLSGSIRCSSGLPGLLCCTCVMKGWGMCTGKVLWVGWSMCVFSFLRFMVVSSLVGLARVVCYLVR